MDDLEKLNKAIAMARRVHDRMTGPADGQAMINGTLIDAVELLAKALRAPGQPTPEQPTTKACEFDEGLVEQLARVFVETPQSGGYVDTWNAQPDRVKESVKSGITGILSELAKAPVELPTDSDVMGAWTAGFIANGGNEAAAHVAQFLRARIAPAIAARDAEIARLNHVAGHQESEITRLRTLTETSESARRIEELETRERFHKERIAELEKRLAERSTPVDASGKTPGQVIHEASEYAYKEAGFDTMMEWNTLTERGKRWRESAALAVLRAFGGEALRRVRDHLTQTAAMGLIELDIATETIDAELAKLGVKE